MAKKKGVHGSGMTARPVTRYSGDDIREGMELFANRWNAAIEGESSVYGAFVAPAVEWATKVCEELTDLLHPDDHGDYAQQILSLHRAIMGAVNSGDAASAARYGVEMGRVCSTAEIKDQWENHALRGLGTLESARRGHEQRYGTAEQKAERRADYQIFINELYKRRPDMSHEWRKKEAAKKFKVSTSTIRNHTVNPATQKKLG